MPCFDLVYSDVKVNPFQPRMGVFTKHFHLIDFDGCAILPTQRPQGETNGGKDFVGGRHWSEGVCTNHF
jgi:hypothetical protein